MGNSRMSFLSATSMLCIFLSACKVHLRITGAFDPYEQPPAA